MPLSLETTMKVEAIKDERVKVVRHGHLTETVAVVNGLGGCGKSLLAAIVGSLARVELMKYNYHLEHVCMLRYLNLLDADTAASLVKNYTDLDLYNLMMSRETNFRPTDVSSVKMSVHAWRYVRRLLLPEGQAAVERIPREHPILHLITHHLLGISSPLFDGLGERLRFIEVVRHPLYMIKQWYHWMPSVGTHPRVFTLRFEYDGQPLPWFARGWEELYLRSGSMDRVIYGLSNQIALGERVWQHISEAQRKHVLVIPFEQFVVRPDPFLTQLEVFLGTHRIPATRWVMKKQCVPRKMFAEGIGLWIYRRCGWEPPAKDSDERTELAERRRYAAEHATPAAMEELDRLSRTYEETYMRGLL